MEITKAPAGRKLEGLAPDCLSSLFVSLNTVFSLPSPLLLHISCRGNICPRSSNPEDLEFDDNTTTKFSFPTPYC